MEAIKSMFACLPSAAGPLFSATPASEDLKDAKMRARAWALVSSEAKRPAVSIPGLQVCPDIPSVCKTGICEVAACHGHRHAQCIESILLRSLKPAQL